MKVQILIDTNKMIGVEVKSIYNLDAYVYLAASHGLDKLVIKEPDLSILDQINRLRPEYSISYIVNA